MAKASPSCPSTSPRKWWQLMPHPLPQGKEAPGWGGKSEHDAYLSSFPRGHGEACVQSGLCLSSANDVAPENWSRQSLQ